MKFKDHDSAITRIDIPGASVRAGDRGTIVSCYTSKPGLENSYEVEFIGPKSKKFKYGESFVVTMKESELLSIEEFNKTIEKFKIGAFPNN